MEELDRLENGTSWKSYIPAILAIVGAFVMMAQFKAVLFSIAFSGIGSAILYKLVDLVIGLRVATDVEREGLDLAEHGERAYNM